MQNCLTVNCLGFGMKKYSKKITVVTYWLLMQNARTKERGFWWDIPTSQHDLAVGYFSEATETCFLTKLTSEPDGEKSGQVSSESVDADVNFKDQFQGWALITSPHLHPFHSVYARQPHLEQKHFIPLNILCFSLYMGLPFTYSLCAAQSHTSWRVFIWDSKEYQQMDNNQHLTAMTYILMKQNLGTTLIPSWIIQRSSNSGPELLLTDLDLMKASENSH